MSDRCRQSSVQSCDKFLRHLIRETYHIDAVSLRRLSAFKDINYLVELEACHRNGDAPIGADDSVDSIRGGGGGDASDNAPNGGPKREK